MENIIKTIEEVKAEFCDHYCKYPYTWDEEKEGMALADSEICRTCPMSIWDQEAG